MYVRGDVILNLVYRNLFAGSCMFNVSAGLLMIPPKISDSREVRREHEEGTRYRHQQGRFLQGLGQRQSAQAARHRQGPIFLEDRREEDQGSWRCLHSDRIKTPSFILHKKMMVFFSKVENKIFCVLQPLFSYIVHAMSTRGLGS